MTEQQHAPTSVSSSDRWELNVFQFVLLAFPFPKHNLTDGDCGSWYLTRSSLHMSVVSATTIHQHHVCATEMPTNYRSFISASHWIEHPSAIVSVTLTYPARPHATDMLTICCLLFLVSYMEEAPSVVVSAASTDQN